MMEETKLVELYHNAQKYGERRLRSKYGDLTDEFPGYCVEVILSQNKTMCGLHFLLVDFLRHHLGRVGRPSNSVYHAMRGAESIDDIQIACDGHTEELVDLWRVWSAMDSMKLTDRECEIFTRTMLIGETSEEVAADLKCTLQNINQLKLQIAKRMRRHINTPKVSKKYSDKVSKED
jgi:hypothetical protein